MKIVFFGLSLSSSWGNGHATTYRGLLRSLARRGHDVVFYEKDQPWYADHRDLTDPDYCTLRFYGSLDDVDPHDLASADAVVVGSYVPDAANLVAMVRAHGSALCAFYDIDTPVTLAKLAKGEGDYLPASLVPSFDIYFSFTGGPILKRLESEFGARHPVLLGCSADPEVYRPLAEPRSYALGYLGTYDESRQPMLERLLIEPARRLPEKRFIVAGPQYPADIDWPANVERLDHLPPAEHAAFYNSLEFAVNVTRADMVRVGYSPSVRLFEAAACGRPVITDRWNGLESFFEPEAEILVADGPDVVVQMLAMPREDRERLGEAGCRRVLRDHTGDARAETMEQSFAALIGEAEDRQTMRRAG